MTHYELCKKTAGKEKAKTSKNKFTCPECRQVSSFDFTNLIFKHVEFYCNSCGHGYKVSNPMFADSKVHTAKYKG